MTPKSPIRFVEQYDHRNVSEDDLQELSQQIESILERGRKLRELKSSISKSSPSKTLEMVEGSGTGIGLPRFLRTGGGVATDTALTIG